jgi:hypothetical protein
VHISQRGARSYAVLHVFCVLTKVTHDKNFTLELGCIMSLGVRQAPDDVRSGYL